MATTSTVGDRVADYRRQRGLSQRELAAAMKRSESWVSQVERGVQPVERLSVLQALANTLGVALQDLQPDVSSSTETDSPPNDLDALRLQLSGHPTLARLFEPTSEIEATDITELRAQVERAWDITHASRFSDLSESLTSLLPQLESSARQENLTDDPEIHALRASAYQAAAAAFARQDEPDAAWVAADRAIAAAELSNDPLQVVAGHFRLAHAFIRLQRYDQADYIATNAINALQTFVDRDGTIQPALSLLGAMHLVRAVISAHESNRAQAHFHLHEAEELAERLGEGRDDYATEFGPTNVQLHRVAVAIDLGDAGEALDVAVRIDASHLSPERQARLLMDVARAHTQRRHVGEATASLIEAERVSPEQVRSHHLTHETATDLLTIAGRRPPRELADLAERIGVL